MEMRHYIRAAGLMRTILATLLTDTLVSCSTIPEPIKDNIKYPHTFHDVGYLEKYGRIAFDDIEDLLYRPEQLRRHFIQRRLIKQEGHVYRL